VRLLLQVLLDGVKLRLELILADLELIPSHSQTILLLVLGNDVEVDVRYLLQVAIR